MLCWEERLGILAIVFMEFILVYNVHASSGTIGKSIKTTFGKSFLFTYEISLFSNFPKNPLEVSQ